MFGPLAITDSTTREELIDHVDDLEEEVQKLEAEVQDLEAEVQDLVLAPVQLERLAEAADVLADLGRIHNTPRAKRQWIDGE